MPRHASSDASSNTPPSRMLSPSSSDGRSPTSSLRALELEHGPQSASLPGSPYALRRTNTLLSMGGFECEQLPLSLSTSDPANDPAHHTEDKHVGLLHAMALVVGMQVGSGIFSSPGGVVASVGSVGASLVVWFLSGLLAWTGASSFAELGCAIPLSGGAQAYLAYAFGPMASYLYTWSAVSALKPGSAAIIALVFGEYVNRMIYHAFTGEADRPVPQWTIKITAGIAIVLISLLNLISPTSGTHSAVVLTFIKIGSLVFVAVLGLIYFIRNGPGPAFSNNLFTGSSKEPGSYATALYLGLWAFDGWDQCSFVGGEMKNPNRDLPRALHASMTIVLILFLSANVAYFIVLDPAVVASSNTVALDFGRVTIGRFGALVFSTLVAISCFGALNGSFYTTARLIYAASRDHFLPSIFARLSAKRRTPDFAMALNAGLTIFFVIFGGGFRTLVNFFSVTSWTLYLATITGMLYLRVKEPHLERPYRAWTSTPVIFCLVAMFLLLMPIFAAPMAALASFMFMGAGIPMYYLTALSRARSAGKGYNRVDTDDDGIRATLSYAWATFADDVISLLPQRWGQKLDRIRPAATPTVDDTEERRGMLADRIEMSEL